MQDFFLSNCLTRWPARRPQRAACGPGRAVGRLRPDHRSTPRESNPHRRAFSYPVVTPAPVETSQAPPQPAGTWKAGSFSNGWPGRSSTPAGPARTYWIRSGAPTTIKGRYEAGLPF
jgi:hypothetical protein